MRERRCCRADGNAPWTTASGGPLTYLRQAGLVDQPARGRVVINAAGRDALASNPDRIDMKTLEAYPAYLDFRERTREKTQPIRFRTWEMPPRPTVAPRPPTSGSGGGDEPRRRGGRGPQGRDGSVADWLEDLVIALLSRMGYGRAGSVERTSASGDAGVDGIISQDPLGLDGIYVQAKRYAEDRTIDRPKIHEFAVPSSASKGDRGVLITTSRFSAGVAQEAERINARIELIDGRRLAELLVFYGWVSRPRSVTLYRLDRDYFEFVRIPRMTDARRLVDKLWSYCDVLRDDGVGVISTRSS